MFLLLRTARRATDPPIFIPAGTRLSALLLVATTARRVVDGLCSTTFEQDLRRLRRALERAMAITCISGKSMQFSSTYATFRL